jgi:hypothetical protein
MTTPTSQNIGQAYLAEARARLAACHDRIRHCLDQLDDAQLWWRPQRSMNSVANVVLHLCGNLRQWMVAGVGGAPDVRDRPQEFAERGPLPKAELFHRLKAAVDEADAVLAGVADARLLDPRHIQGFDLTVLTAIFDCLSHLAGHTQEIVYATRLQLGDTYHFAWAPATPEQGAPPAPPGKAIEEAVDAVFEEGPSVLPDPASPLGDYVREIGEEFQEEEDEGKV